MAKKLSVAMFFICAFAVPQVAFSDMTLEEEFAAAKRLRLAIDSKLTDAQRKSIDNSFACSEAYKKQAARLKQDAALMRDFTEEEIAQLMMLDKHIGKAIDKAHNDAVADMTAERRSSFDSYIYTTYRAQSYTTIRNLDDASRWRLAWLRALETYDSDRFVLAMSTLVGDDISYQADFSMCEKPSR